jgi:hypothetical protein
MRRLNHPGGLIQKDRMVMLQCVISVCTCAAECFSEGVHR